LVYNETEAHSSFTVTSEMGRGETIAECQNQGFAPLDLKYDICELLFIYLFVYLVR